VNYERLYEYRFRHVNQEARIALWREIAAHVYRMMGQPRRVLDPAAGRGEFINAIPAEERWAVDMVAHTHGTYDAEVRAVTSNIFETELPAGHFDGVFVSNFLEHLSTQEEAAAFLERMHAATAPGGRIAIMGPNFRYCKSQYFDMADHTLIYTHRAIAEHVYTAGFTPERIIPRYLPYSFTGHLPPSRFLTSMYLRMPLAWRILGKQFLVIGRR
jgi:2-polyprenyl-3-methyl-5-hydroxy-6-metoxy-1,4-benzoquinol methylase